MVAMPRPGAVALVCNPYHRGGITRWVVDFAIRWWELGGECWLVAPRPVRPFVNGRDRPTVVELFAEQAPSGGPHLIAPDVGWEFEFGTEAYRAGVLERAVSGGVPSGVPLVMTDDPATWLACARLAEHHPMVGVMHSDDPHYYELAHRYRAYLAAVVAVSRRTGTTIAHALGAESLPQAVIPCGVRVGDLTPDTAHAESLRLIWAGRMVEGQKRVSDLPAIAALLEDRGVPFTLSLYGDGPARASIERGVQGTAAESRVVFHGWRPPNEVAAAMARADLLLLPSNYEGMSVSVMEALSVGCGVVASRISGIEDVETNPLAARCLWVYDVGDVRSAADRVVTAAATPREVRRESAHELAVAEFSLDRCVGRYADLLRTLSPRRERPSIWGDLRFRVQRAASGWVAAQRVARLRARRVSVVQETA